uniref:Uncharacterized protein n=1 Tax=Anopheles stephensi TaxID=30069 RepID=A0A182Y964_ANOST
MVENSVTIDFESVCRFCLTNAGVFQSIFDHEIVDIAAIVKTITNLEVSKDDPFSKVACNSCIDIVRCIVDFRDKCISSFHESEQKLLALEEASLAKELQLHVEFIKCDSPGDSGCNSYEQEGAITNLTDTDNEDEDAPANTETQSISEETAKNTLSKSTSNSEEVENTTTCTECGECVSGGKQMLTYHMKSDHADDGGLPKIRQCFFCPKAYSSYQLLKYHLNFHPQKLWQCPQCDKRIHNKASFIDHLRIHANERYYVCKECGKQFTALKYLSTHSRVHKRNTANASSKSKDVKGSVKDTPLESFSQPEPLASPIQSTTLLEKLAEQEPETNLAHVDSLHSQDQKVNHLQNGTETYQSGMYECEVCGKKLKTKSNYTNHRKMHDRKETKAEEKIVPISSHDTVQRRVYLCNICGHNCGSSSNLGVHLRRHNGQSVCECSVCGKGFPRRSDLVMHMRKHTGEKPFICPTCGRGFSRLDKLRIHTRTHTGEKPYKCPCGRAYAQVICR